MAARKKRRTNRKDNTPGWVWMLFGLALGLTVALGIYIGFSPGNVDADSIPDVAVIDTAPVPAEPPEQSMPTIRAQTDPPEESPESRFEFYELLPRFEVVIPEVETAEPGRAQAAAIDEPGLYVLQAGSFRSLVDADRQKASLALLGIESKIQTVAIDEDTFHRVRIGPSSDLDALNRTRRLLLESRIDALVMRLAD